MLIISVKFIIHYSYLTIGPNRFGYNGNNDASLQYFMHYFWVVAQQAFWTIMIIFTNMRTRQAQKRRNTNKFLGKCSKYITQRVFRTISQCPKPLFKIFQLGAFIIIYYESTFYGLGIEYWYDSKYILLCRHALVLMAHGAFRQRVDQRWDPGDILWRLCLWLWESAECCCMKILSTREQDFPPSETKN